MTEKQMFDYLVSNGLTETGAAAALGNFKAESALRANNLQDSFNKKLSMTDEEYTSAVDCKSYMRFAKDSAGYGLAQWTYSSRKQSLLDFALARHSSIGDTSMQLDFFLQEVRGYKSVWKVLSENSDIESATVEMMTKYEKPADQSNKAKATRVLYAKEIFDRCAGGNPTAEPLKLTEDDIRAAFVAAGEKYLGVKEEDKSHWQIIDKYNDHTPLPRNYKVKYTDSWCATYVSVVVMDTKLTGIIPVECSCGNLITMFKNMNSWVEKDSYIPKPGDIIFYDWDDNGIGDNTGWPDHVGIVKSVLGSTIKVLEGNLNNAVGYRNIQVNAKGIRGFGVPRFAEKATIKNVASTEKSISVTAPSKDPKWLGEVYNCAKLNIRKWAGKEYAPLQSRPALVASDRVEVCDTLLDSQGKEWYYVRVDGRTFGFVSADYIRRNQ